MGASERSVRMVFQVNGTAKFFTIDIVGEKAGLLLSEDVSLLGFEDISGRDIKSDSSIDDSRIPAESVGVVVKRSAYEPQMKKAILYCMANDNGKKRKGRTYAKESAEIGVSVRTIRKARTIIRRASEELKAAILNGQVKFKYAERFATMDHDAQRAAIAEMTRATQKIVSICDPN